MNEGPTTSSPGDSRSPRSHTDSIYLRGMVPILFDRNPRATSWMMVYFPAIFIGYCAIVALAVWLKLPGVHYWFALWSPVIDLMRQALPVFDYSERELTAAGFPHRVAIIHHLFAMGWLAIIPTLTLAVIFVARTSRADWVRLISIWPRYGFVLFAVAGSLAFGVVLYWMATGVGRVSENPMFARHRSDLALLGIGVFFYALVIFGVSSVVSIGASLAPRPKRE